MAHIGHGRTKRRGPTLDMNVGPVKELPGSDLLSHRGRREPAAAPGDTPGARPSSVTRALRGEPRGPHRPRPYKKKGPDTRYECRAHKVPAVTFSPRGYRTVPSAETGLTSVLGWNGCDPAPMTTGKGSALDLAWRSSATAKSYENAPVARLPRKRHARRRFASGCIVKDQSGGRDICPAALGRSSLEGGRGA